MKVLKSIGNFLLKGIDGYCKFVGKHPFIGYVTAALPACFLMYNGALDLAGKGIGCEDAHDKAYADGYAQGATNYKEFVESQMEQIYGEKEED